MSLESTLIELSEKAWEANRNGDAEFYARFLVEAPLSVSQWGLVDDREAILRGFAENRNPYTRTEQSDHRVVALGEDGAVHTSTVEIDVLMNGTEKQTMRVFATTAFVRRDGEWKAALFQITPAPAR
ncbi:nuclear transport factor 2 family protein [Planomonospora sp. ID67723]|uniref:nuclear transport factor 2 family protein n=1 Tax=Planomonospora sp. ID67723 TaxID=2738134 RepID=UPI0018C3A001|nr:nuclear transport factor 2 family protein [Planomonospora sp. ID67723]MBG0827341.1 nuclear transport factor 2 family protein [Planomonospora sp. ID67723]